MADKNFKLSINTYELAEEFFEDTRLLGIMAPIKDYQFCWHLNNLMDIDFRINIDIEIQLRRKNRNYYFSVYQYQQPTSTLCHYLYRNLFDGEYLLPEFKHLDFLWLMKNDIVDDSYLQDTIQALRTLNGVQLVTELTNEKIKNKEHLIF